VKSRVLLAAGLGLFLVAGFLAAWAAYGKGSTTTTRTVTHNGTIETVTVSTVEALPGHVQTVTINHGGHTATVRVPVAVPGPSVVRTVRAQGTTTPGPTRTVTTARVVTTPARTTTVRQTTTVPGPTRTVTRVETQTVAQTVPGPATTVTRTVTETETVTVGHCPPNNPHC